MDNFFNIGMQKYFGPFSGFLDPEMAVLFSFLDTKTAPFLQFLDCHSIASFLVAGTKIGVTLGFGASDKLMMVTMHG